MALTAHARRADPFVLEYGNWARWSKPQWQNGADRANLYQGETIISNGTLSVQSPVQSAHRVFP